MLKGCERIEMADYCPHHSFVPIISYYFYKTNNLI